MSEHKKDAHAEFIARACRSYEALVAACDKMAAAVGPVQEDGSCYMNGRDLLEARDAALSALAIARGEVTP